MKKLDFMKTYFCYAKDSVKRMKDNPTDWDYIFANRVSDKRLIFRIYKERSKLKGKEKKNHQKMADRLEETFNKRGYIDGK